MASRNLAARDCPSAFCEVVSRAMAVSGWHACIRSARMRVLAGMILLFLFTSAAGESPATMESVRAPHDVSLSTDPSLSFWQDRKSTRLNSSHQIISYAVFCLKKKKKLENFVRDLVS